MNKQSTTTQSADSSAIFSLFKKVDQGSYELFSRHPFEVLQKQYILIYRFKKKKKREMSTQIEQNGTMPILTKIKMYIPIYQS